MSEDKIYYDFLSSVIGEGVATVAAASVVTSLISGIFIGALLRHFIPRRFQKKPLKSSKADNYEHPNFSQGSNSNQVETSGEEQYAELQIRDD